MRIFTDTSAFYASLVRNDGAHPMAAPTMGALLERGHTLVTSSCILAETMALLHARAGLAAALDFDRALRPLLEVHWVQAELHARAAHRLAARGNQKVGFVDCASFVLMEHLGLRTAFAYDRDFEREGFELMTRAEQVGG